MQARHRQRAQAPGLDVVDDRTRRGKHQRHLPADYIGYGLTAALVIDARDVDAGHRLEQLGGEMRRRTGRTRRIVQLAGPRFGERDQLLHRLDRQRRIDHDQIRRARYQYQRREVFHRVPRQIALQKRCQPERTAGDQQRVSIGRGARHDLAQYHAARPVLDDDLLLERAGQRLRDDARGEIAVAAGAAGNETHRLGRESLRVSRCCNGNAQARCDYHTAGPTGARSHRQ